MSPWYRDMLQPKHLYPEVLSGVLTHEVTADVARVVHDAQSMVQHLRVALRWPQGWWCTYPHPRAVLTIRRMDDTTMRLQGTYGRSHEEMYTSGHFSHIDRH
jgi:hypothetical protein